jgi:hypothetical protein
MHPTRRKAISQWGVFEEHDDEGYLTVLHVIPVHCLDIEDDVIEMSAAHILSAACPCRPVADGINESSGVPILNHHDPEHPGALSDDEWCRLGGAKEC